MLEDSILEESGILDEENGEEYEYMEVDDGLAMAQSDGSASVPSTSVSDKEDSVNNLNVCINLSSISEFPRFHGSLAITNVHSVLDNTLSSDISNSCTSSLSVTGISSCCRVSNTNACMLSPTIANISATTTVAAATVATTVATTATTTTTVATNTVAAATVATTVAATVATTVAATATTTTVATTVAATASTTTVAAAAAATAATITTTTATVSSTSITTVATATTNSGAGTTVRSVYPKFGLFQFSEPVGPTQILPASATAIKFFMQIFDDSLFQHIVDQTNLYVSQMPSRSARYGWYDTTVTEMKAFVGVLLLMGIHQLPSIADYWSTHKYLGVPTISAVFPANRFNHLLASIHFSDNSNAKPRGHPEYDKLYKIRPVMESILQKCLSLYNPHRENSIDEAMVGFKGRSSLKQYMPNKPTKRGYKIWCRCDSRNGYTCCFQVYTGKVGNTSEKNLGARVVTDLSKDVLNKGFHLYFDNFFSSPSLLADLYTKNTYCVGTVRVNRKHFPIFGKRAIKGLGRGQSLSKEVLQNNVHCFVWQDKKPVAFVNTISDSCDFAVVRRKQSDGSTTLVRCPSAVVLYNTNMGGVDLADQKRKMYSASRKSKVKWYMRLFYYFLDIAVVNAHVLECESPNHIPTRRIGKKKKFEYRTQKSFVIQLIEELIGSHTSRKKMGRPKIPLDSIRYSEPHYPTMYDKPSECVYCSKPSARKRSKYGCNKCGGVHLCVYPCFEKYHTKQ